MLEQDGLAFEISRKLRRPDKKHWYLQKDGDVWYAIWRIILAKSPQAIKVTKLKGHATEEDVTVGIIIEVDKSGNHISDTLVKEATLLHGQGTVDLAKWLGCRHNAYCSMLEEVQRFIIRMMSLEKEERAAGIKLSIPLLRLPFPSFPYPSALTTTPVTSTGTSTSKIYQPRTIDSANSKTRSVSFTGFYVLSN